MRPPLWLVRIALPCNALCSLYFMLQRDVTLWLLFTAFAVINIHSLISRDRVPDPRKDTP